MTRPGSDVTTRSTVPPGWTPIRVSWSAGRPVIDCCYTEGMRFTDPFFDQTVERCLREPFRLLFRRCAPIEALGESVGTAPAPTGLVFHLSRCGSTLVTQMLAARSDTLVMSEPRPLEPLLAARHAPAAERAQWLRWMVAALGRAAVDGQRHYVVKLDAWAALDLPLLAEAFPDTAFVFLYRDPVEVLVSQAGHRGYHMLPFTLDPARLGLTAQQVASLSPDDYGAAVLGRITEAAVTAARAGRLLLVEYPELPAAVGDRIAPHLGMPVGAAEAAAMSAVTGMHAKNQVSAFVDDSATKQRAAPPQLRDAAERWAMPAYQELRELRRRQQRDDGGVPGTASGRPA